MHDSFPIRGPSIRVEWEEDVPKETGFVPIACRPLEKAIASDVLFAQSLTSTTVNASPLSDEYVQGSGLALAQHLRSANMRNYMRDVLEKHGWYA